MVLIIKICYKQNYLFALFFVNNNFDLYFKYSKIFTCFINPRFGTRGVVVGVVILFDKYTNQQT